MKLGELVVVPLMEDAKSLAAFILSSADLSQSVTSAATALDRFLSPALLGLPVPPTPDSAPPSSPASDAGAMMMDMPRLDRRGSTEALPNGTTPGHHRAGLALTMEAALFIFSMNKKRNKSAGDHSYPRYMHHLHVMWPGTGSGTNKDKAKEKIRRWPKIPRRPPGQLLW